MRCPLVIDFDTIVTGLKELVRELLFTHRLSCEAILCAKCIEIARNEARGIAEHTWPCAKPRGGWPPTLLQARFEQFLGAGGMIPDGNRRHTTKSGRIIHKVKLLLELHNHIAGSVTSYSRSLFTRLRQRRSGPSGRANRS